MKVIDYRLNQDGLGGTEHRFFKDCWVRIKKMGYKTWLEGPEGDSEAPDLEPLLDFREDGLWRGVHGYISYGFVGSNAAVYTTPGIRGGHEHVWAEDVAMWLPQQFINWKENYFEPQLHSERRVVSCHFPNAVRLWLRDDVRAFVHFNVDVVDGFVGKTSVTDPSTGTLKYDSFNPPNAVPPI